MQQHNIIAWGVRKDVRKKTGESQLDTCRVTLALRPVSRERTKVGREGKSGQRLKISNTDQVSLQ